ncbi:unnamed protein product, partial [Tenebrio molitor]
MSSENGLKQTKLTDATYTPIGLIVWDRAVIQNRFFFSTGRLNSPLSSYSFLPYTVYGAHYACIVFRGANFYKLIQYY